MNMKNKKIVSILIAAALIALALAITTGVIQLPGATTIKSQEQASKAIGDIGSGVEKIESTITDIESSLK